MRRMAMVIGAVGLWLGLVADAGADVTVRIGEQDTCKFAGGTAVSSGKSESTIRFDLSKLPPKAEVKKAVLRLWVDYTGKDRGSAFAFTRWDDASFDGFKIWQVGAEETPLATAYPFVFTYCGCLERRWLYVHGWPQHHRDPQRPAQAKRPGRLWGP